MLTGPVPLFYLPPSPSWNEPVLLCLFSPDPDAHIWMKPKSRTQDTVTHAIGASNARSYLYNKVAMISLCLLCKLLPDSSFPQRVVASRSCVAFLPTIVCFIGS